MAQVLSLPSTPCLSFSVFFVAVVVVVIVFVFIIIVFVFVVATTTIIVVMKDWGCERIGMNAERIAYQCSPVPQRVPEHKNA